MFNKIKEQGGIVMSLLSAHNLHKYYAGNPVLLDVSCFLERGERVGLIGRNGTGKTTLLRLLAQLEDYDAGQIRMANGIRLGYLTQGVELPDEMTVWQVASLALGTVMELEVTLRNLEALMGQPQIMADQERLAKVMGEYTRVSAEFERLGGYEREVQVRTILNGLGLPEPVWGQPIGSLSGGQRTRVALAKLLLEQPDILFLDEPTNHLDVEAIAWLEANLASYQGALLVVSHDREFLDNVVTKIWDLHEHNLTAYVGNYSAYLQQKEEWAKRQEVLLRQQEREREQLEGLIAKFKAGTRSTMAKSWEKRLARMEPIQLSRKQRTMHLTIQAKRRSGNDVLQIQALSKAYPNKPLFSDFSAEVKLRERIALLGPNGCGKTTLLKILLGEVPADRGRLRWGASIDLGYFSQDLRLPEEDVSVLDSLLAGSKLLPAEGRNYLARFLFVGDAVFQPVSTLSGGERNRLILAKLLLTQANVLVLDEPTNHLDIPAREVLEQALYEYPGTLFIVSHDRYFLRRMATRIWHFADGAIHDYPMGYAAFLAELERQQAASTLAAKPQVGQPVRTQKEAAPISLEQLAQTLGEIEHHIASLEAERDSLYAQMADASLYQDGGGQETVLRCRQLEHELEQLYGCWERQAAIIEARQPQ